jgi:hypothetical protein
MASDGSFPIPLPSARLMLFAGPSGTTYFSVGGAPVPDWLAAEFWCAGGEVPPKRCACSFAGIYSRSEFL